MANYHLSGKIFSRSKGHSAVAAASYRSGEKLHDERMDMTYDYTRKHQILGSEIIAPEHAPDWVYDRETLWNKVEASEKQVNSQVVREIEVSLPRELDFDTQQSLVREYVKQEFISQNMVADASYHTGASSDGGDNPHAHILLTMREIEEDGFARKKNRDWNKKESLVGWREAWADVCNDYLEEAGSNEIVDHRSYYDQGLDIEPTIHMGKDATHMERQGISTDRGDINREIMHQNRVMMQIQAAASWMKKTTIEIYQEIKHRLYEPEKQEQLILEPEPPENDKGFSR